MGWNLVCLTLNLMFTCYSQVLWEVMTSRKGNILGGINVPLDFREIFRHFGKYVDASRKSN